MRASHVTVVSLGIPVCEMGVIISLPTFEGESDEMILL